MHVRSFVPRHYSTRAKHSALQQQWAAVRTVTQMCCGVWHTLLRMQPLVTASKIRPCPPQLHCTVVLLPLPLLLPLLLLLLLLLVQLLILLLLPCICKLLSERAAARVPDALLLVLLLLACATASTKCCVVAH
jgi:hypothetical protein